MNIFQHFICPVCKSQLSKIDNQLKCDNNHSFDFSSSGYINLLNPGKKNNAKAGDSKEMIRARTGFFASQAYKNIAKKIFELSESLSPSLIVDAGCGEGYYTEFLTKINTHPTVLGFDMSKYGCEHGAKSAKRQEIENICYAVGNIFDLPLKNECTDLIVNMFAPVASEEFSRILKPGGHFIVASAGIDHLDGLKSVLYDDVYKNEEKILEYKNFNLVACENLKYSVKINGNDTISNLFMMTPYYHRTSLEDKKKLENIQSLTTTVEVNFSIYKKLSI